MPRDKKVKENKNDQFTINYHWPIAQLHDHRSKNIIKNTAEGKKFFWICVWQTCFQFKRVVEFWNPLTCWSKDAN